MYEVMIGEEAYGMYQDIRSATTIAEYLRKVITDRPVWVRPKN